MLADLTIPGLKVCLAQIMTKGILAFVSFVRAYANHHCSFIFRLANIDYVGLARARGLLTLPKVPEIRQVSCLFGQGSQPITLVVTH